VLLGVIGVAVRLDAPGDGTVVSFWQVNGVIIDVPDPADSPDLHSGDLVTVIAGHRLAEGLGGLPAPVPGVQLSYDIVRNAPDPDAALLRFLQTTYRAAADLGHWPAGLDCELGRPRRPRAVD